MSKAKSITTKAIVKAIRLTADTHYSKGFEYDLVLFVTFFENSTEEEVNNGELVIFKREAFVQSYAGLELKGLEIYHEVNTFQSNWTIKEKLFVESNMGKEFSELKLKKSLFNIINELNNEII